MNRKTLDFKSYLSARSEREDLLKDQAQGWFKGKVWPPGLYNGFQSNIKYFIYFASYKVIALPTIAVAIVGRAITIWEAIQKRSHEPIYKTNTKMKLTD